jgi:hypothetical protein
MTIKTTIRLIARFTLVSLLAGYSLKPLAQSDYRIAFVRNKEICVTGPSKAIECLTNDNRSKFLPVWSVEGDQIAYVTIDENLSVLATLYVIDRRGKRLAEIPIKALEPGEIRSGMRQVEALEWLSGNRLVVSGTVNPSSTEYLVVNTSKLKVIDEFVVDGFGASFSPDGLSYIATTGAPHFTKKESRGPALIVDGRRLSKLVPDNTEFAGVPSWAPDGSTVAIPIRYVADSPINGVDVVVLWQRNSGATRSVNLPSRTRDVKWNSTGLLARTTPVDGLTGQLVDEVKEGWELHIATKPFQILDWKHVDDVALLNMESKDRKLRADLRGSTEADGGINIDVWCNQCDLSKRPRRVPVN